VNWSGRLLVSHAVMQLFEETTTRAGLMVNAELNNMRYPTDTKVSEKEIASAILKLSAFHGE
jgi:hypothetical protein